MRNVPDDEPRSFRLSRGPSDVWILFAVIAYGAVILVVPAAGPWIMRTGMVILAFFFGRYLQAVRRLVHAGAWTPSPSTFVGTVIGLGVLGVWIWYLGRGFLAGKWIDAGIASVLVAERTYLEWLKRKVASFRGLQTTRRDCSS